ncbi:MAG: glutathione S-transferase N-terminal domain-containing protein, partial [Kiloniellales bacterium]
MGEGAALILHGPAYSAYVRVVLLVLREKGLSCELRPLDLLSGDTLPRDYLR